MAVESDKFKELNQLARSIYHKDVKLKWQEFLQMADTAFDAGEITDEERDLLYSLLSPTEG